MIDASTAAAILLVLLGGNGYWMGGRDATIQVQWIAAEAVRPATLNWQLGTDTVQLASGQLALPADGADLKLTIQPPTVRARAVLHLDWQVKDPQGQPLSTGRQRVHLFPNDLLAPLPRLLNNRRLVVVDDESQLPAILRHAQVEHQRVDSLLEVGSMRAQVLLIGQNAWPKDPRGMAILRQAMAGGAAVAVFAQSGDTPTLSGVRFVPRLAPHHLTYRGDHPAFAGLDGDILTSLMSEQPRAMWSAIRIKPDGPVVPMALWGPVAQDGPWHDAAAAIVQLEGAPLLLWQIPLTDWSTDPRSHIVLLNVIDSLLVANPLSPVEWNHPAWKTASWTATASPVAPQKQSPQPAGELQ